MKGKILPLFIGILIGAIITTAGFLIYNKAISATSPDMMQMNGNGNNGEAPEKPDGDNGETPEKPDGDNGEEPPAKPDESNSNTNS